MATSKTVGFPLTLTNGRINISNDPGAELDILLAYPARRRVRDRNYGIDLRVLQQAALNTNDLVPVALVELRTKFLQYVKNTNLESARLFTERSKPRTLFIQVNYREKQQLFTRTFEQEVNFRA